MALLLNVDECCVSMWKFPQEAILTMQDEKKTRIYANIEGSVSVLFTLFGSFMAMEPGLLLISFFVYLE